MSCNPFGVKNFSNRARSESDWLTRDVQDSESAYYGGKVQCVTDTVTVDGVAAAQMKSQSESFKRKAAEEMDAFKSAQLEERAVKKRPIGPAAPATVPQKPAAPRFNALQRAPVNSNKKSEDGSPKKSAEGSPKKSAEQDSESQKKTHKRPGQKSQTWKPSCLQTWKMSESA